MSACVGTRYATIAFIHWASTPNFNENGRLRTKITDQVLALRVRLRPPAWFTILNVSHATGPSGLVPGYQLGVASYISDSGLESLIGLLASHMQKCNGVSPLLVATFHFP